MILYLSYLVSVNIDDGGATPVVGQNYTLTCRVNGATGTFTSYQWRKDGQTLSAENDQSLSLSPLTLSHAGQYTCAVRVDSRFYNNSTTVAIKSMHCMLTKLSLHQQFL